MIINGGKDMWLFRKPKNNVEKTDEMCEVCGKTLKNIIDHKNKHVCEECYLKILHSSKDEK